MFTELSSSNPKRPCPICSAVDVALLFPQRFEPLAGISLTDGYDVVTCRKCGFVFADGIPSKETFDRYYANASKYEFAHQGGEQPAIELERLATLAEWIAERVPLSSRLVDAGCATGGLLVQLRQRGFTNLTGLDPSSGCVEVARTRHGLRMIQGVLGEKPPGEPPFDVLILSAVLEHIPDLQPFVRQLENWLTPCGLLVVEVPDAETFTRGFNAPYQEFSVEHINFFSSASLTNLFRFCGFAALAVRQSVCSFGPGVTGSVLTMLFRRGTEPAAPVKETMSEQGVRAYLSSCEAWVTREQELIRELVNSQQPILVWGAGTLCQRLLATTDLSRANILAFIDSNPHYHGKILRGRPVLAPAELARYPEPVLISSWAFYEEICAQIRNQLKLGNKILAIHKSA
ncbi:MAG: methyltransferase domain-containing protein [Verrucomicrobia bacterium]|nr:methyltransferase domain-containing protein [Verrucomicrobiota bacterium]